MKKLRCGFVGGGTIMRVHAEALRGNTFLTVPLVDLGDGLGMALAALEVCGPQCPGQVPLG